jgi:hypothetical protein
MILHLLEVGQCFWHLQSMLSKGCQCNAIKRSQEEKTSYQLIDTVAALLAVLHVLECSTKTVALQLNEAPPLRKRDIIAITLEVVRLAVPMLMEV